ncbi:hypothetical protein CJ030_MR7G021966 [Morella rubra]|uniref:DUF6469 domain-containing protein n=1 Tax=Morella rubra TaxID=262757 RepID=A0A6A1UYN2_9ROSI|nr:hypothetical protein CJ030_MR7G021966 [Morella rubra]
MEADFLDKEGAVPTAYAFTDIVLSWSLEEIYEENLYRNEESRPYGSKLYDVKVDHWKNRHNVRGEEPYKTLPGDIFVFANAKPEDVTDLQRIGLQWAFLAVTKIPEDEHEGNGTSTLFKVKA